MAGVDHAYQYSVEVKSRFSLFMDDSLNNEDPDLLISKLRNERVERVKKDKVNPLPTNRTDAKKVDVEPETEIKQEISQPKGKQVRMPKISKPTTPANEENVVSNEHVEKNDAVSGQTYRGRGGPRGFPRGFRGNRGQGPRQYHAEPTHNGMDDHPPRDATFEHRGRRPRPRGGFNRGRAMNTDFREVSGPVGSELNHDRHTDGQQSTWKEPDSQHVPDAQEEVADVAPDGAGVAEEGQEAGDKDSGAEEPKNYTLEEYKAIRSQSKQTIMLASKGSRKANDGQDVFANMVAHRKTVEVSDDDTEEVEREEEEEPQKFEINFSFNDEFGNRGRQNRGFGNRGFSRGGAGFRGSRPRTDRGNRGARGSFRGESRGRGFQRGAPSQSGYTPVIYNDQEFPSLK